MLEHIALSYGIPLTYIAFVIAALAIVGFSIYQMIGNMKNAMTALVAIGILVLLFVVCYFLSANEPYSIGEIHVSAGQIRWVEAGMLMFYLLLAASVLAIAYSAVSRYFK